MAKKVPEHIIDPNDPSDYMGGLFVEKHWKKMYKTYANDTIQKYWKKEDFPQYNFILEKGTGLIFKYDFLIKYLNTGIDEIIIISEPIYYMNKNTLCSIMKKHILTAVDLHKLLS